MKHDWEYKKLGEVCELRRGLTYSKGDEVAKSSKMVLRSNNIDLESMSLDLTEIKYLREDFVFHEEKMLQGGSVFLCMSNGSKNHVGKVAYIDNDINYAFGGFMGLIVPLEQLVPKYVYYVCRSSIWRGFMINIGKGIGITNLRFSELSTFPIPVPPIEEQKAICEELDDLCLIIEKKKEQVKQLDNLAQSIFYDTFGDPITNEKGWEVKKWDNCITIYNGKNQRRVEVDNGQYPICGSGGIMGWANQYITPENSVIVGRKGNINKPILMRERFWNVDTAFGIYPKENILLVDYLYFFCVIYDFEQLNKAVTIPSLTKIDLLKINMPIPPFSLQQSFAEKVKAIERQKDLINQSIREVQTLFDSRMDYWFAE